ncbi:MAG: hypothetical protein EXQ69_03350 [Acidimicrobiia bacterium]|nr:hypothetical protein [Acidimicrobiia bacterium]
MPTCINGHAALKGARFCRVCGAAVATDAKSAASRFGALDSNDTVPRTGGPEPQGPQPRSRRVLVLAIAAGVVLAASVGAASAFLLASGSDNRRSGALPARGRSYPPSSTTAVSPSTIAAVPPPVSPVPSALCIHDTTPHNLRAQPGIHANVLGLIMVANCEAVDIASPARFEFSADGNETFRLVRWRGMDGWVRSKKVAPGAAPMVAFRAGSDPACTSNALGRAVYAAEIGDYGIADDPLLSVVRFTCTGTGSGALAFAVVQRGKLNPDGRTTEALFRNTGAGWQELARSGPSLLPQDYAHIGISESTVARLRDGAA